MTFEEWWKENGHGICIKYPNMYEAAKACFNAGAVAEREACALLTAQLLPKISDMTLRSYFVRGSFSKKERGLIILFAQKWVAMMLAAREETK